MENGEKSREQLIAEVARLRQRVSELEVSQAALQSQLNHIHKATETDNFWRDSDSKPMIGLERDAEIYLQPLIDAIPDSVLLIKPDGEIVKCNQTVAKRFSQQHEDLIHKNAYSLLEPDIAARRRQHVEQVLEHKKPVEFLDIRLGRIIESSIYPVLGINGQVTYLAIFGEDVTEYVQTFKLLQESEERFRTLAQLVPIGIYLTDQHGHCIFTNQRWQEMTGLSEEQLLKDRWFESLHPDDRLMVMDVWQKNFREGRSEVLEYRLNCAAGHPIWVYDLTTPRYDQDHRLTGFISVVTEITDQKRRENILDSRLRLMQFAETHPLPDVLQTTLDEVEKLTGSSIGFYHYLNEDQDTLSLQQWSSNTLAHLCTLNGSELHYPLEQAGVWVDCIRQGAPVIHNDMESLPHRKGYPQGHALVKRELVVPIFRKNKIVAILGVGNKPTDYLPEDIEVVSLLADLAWDIAERKLAEEQLVIRDTELTAIYENLPAMILLMGQDRRVLKANRALLEGIPTIHQDAVGLLAGEALQCIHAANNPEGCGSNRQCVHCGILNLVKATLLTGKSHYRQEARLEWNPTHPEERFFLMSTVPVNIRDEQCILLTLEDTTERNLAEAALRESEGKYRALFEQSHDAVFILDFSGKHLEANQRAAELLGYSADEFKKLSFKHISDQPFESKQILQRLLKHENVPIFERVFRHKDGRRVTVEINVELVKDTHGRPLHIQSVARDITERKKAEIALRRSEKKYRTLFENMAHGVFYQKDSGEMIDVNPAALKLFGVSRADFLQRPLCPGEMDLIDENHQQIPLEMRPSLQVLRTGEPITNHTVAIYNPEMRDYVWVSVNAIPQFQPGQSKPDHVFVTLHDITPLKRYEAQLQESLRQKDLLLKEIHHRVKNNLQIVSSLIDLQSSVFQDEKVVQLFQDSKSRIHSMALLHEKLYQSSDLARIDISSYIHSLYEFLIGTYGERAENLEVHIEAEQIPITMDIAIPCGMIINELVSNAIKYAFPQGKPGRLEIAFNQSNNSYLLKVADNGIGLPSGFDIKHCSSLGMQLVDWLTQQLKGQLELDTSVGTVVKVLFPLPSGTKGKTNG